MPPCASGPVLMVSRPSLKGAACAMAGVGNLKVASAAPAAVAAMNLRRVTLRDIAFLPQVAPFLGLYVLSDVVRRFVQPARPNFVTPIKWRHSGPSRQSRRGRTVAIIGQCIP